LIKWDLWILPFTIRNIYLSTEDKESATKILDTLRKKYPLDENLQLNEKPNNKLNATRIYIDFYFE
jgi:hypothetical protein